VSQGEIGIKLYVSSLDGCQLFFAIAASKNVPDIVPRKPEGWPLSPVIVSGYTDRNPSLF
jgi:hypothetical protein